MDTKQLFEDLIECKELQEIPIIYISKVAIAVLELVQNNNYVFKIGE